MEMVAAASLRMGGPGESQPNELDHEISFACSMASAMRSGSLRTKRKGVLRKGSFFALANRGKMDKEWVPRGLSGRREWPTGLREQGCQQPAGCLCRAGLSVRNSSFNLLRKHLCASSSPLPQEDARGGGHGASQSRASRSIGGEGPVVSCFVFPMCHRQIFGEIQ